MAGSYDLNSSDPTVRAISLVRFLIPDTEALEFSDTEILLLLRQNNNDEHAAASAACSLLARKYAQVPRFKADGVEVDGSERAKMYAERAAELSSRSSGWSVVAAVRVDA
jgi:hypothetical protein